MIRFLRPYPFDKRAIALVIAIPVGVLSAARPNSAASHVVSLITMVGISLPTFLTGLILILIFSVELGILPMIFPGGHRLGADATPRGTFIRALAGAEDAGCPCQGGPRRSRSRRSTACRWPRRRGRV